MRYSTEIIEEIRSRIYLPDLIRKYTNLNRKNKGLCPFHKERNPSFSVDAKKNRWRCFGCNHGGDAFAFIMEAEHLTFTSAVKLLAFEAGVRLPESDTVKKTLANRWEEKQRKLVMIDCLKDFFKRYVNGRYSTFRLKMKQLPPKEKRDAKDYLKELLIEEQFDELGDFVRERLSLFEETRRMVRNG